MPQPEADYEIDWDDEPLPKIQPPPPPPSADRELAVIQARAAEADGGKIAEGTVTEGDKVELLGKKFRVAEKIGLMPLLKFASASDMSTDDPRALSAVYSMLRDCIYEGKPGCGECKECKADNEVMCKSYDKGDWTAFELHAMDTKADADQLLEVITKVMEIVSGRPTKQPSGSSPGPRATRRVSTANSSETRGRASKR